MKYLSEDIEITSDSSQLFCLDFSDPLIPQIIDIFQYHQ